MRTLVWLAGTATASPRYDIDSDGFDDTALDGRPLYFGSAKGGLASTIPPSL